MTRSIPFDPQAHEYAAAGRAQSAALRALGANATVVDLCMELRTEAYFLTGPKFVFVRMDVDSLVLLQLRQAAAWDDAFNEPSEMPFPCVPRAWDTDSQFKVLDWKFVAGKSEFWVKGGSDLKVGVESHPIPVSLMMACLSGQSSETVEGVEGAASPLRWVGDVLMCASTDIVAFTETVLSRCPEVAARETELQMASRIAFTSTSTHSNPPESEPTTLPTSRRRRGLPV